jgi:outer membrane protein OmpA-like peptidoglycan-associated protein
MYRVKTILPVLLSSVAIPAAAATADYSSCYSAADSVSCLIEQVEFTRERNAEIDRSIARVARVRAFEKARNSEIHRSIAAVNAARDRQLAIEQNALTRASIVAVNAERERQFARHQNELARASVAAVNAERARNLAMSLSHCQSDDDARPRCEAERARDFAAHQNLLAEVSAIRVRAERERAFAAARNAEINASIIAVRIERDRIALQTSHCAANPTTPRCAAERGRELALSLTHCKTPGDTSPRCNAERNNESSIATASINGDHIAPLSAAEYAALTSHCARAPGSPRCEAEKAHEFAALTSHCARNPSTPRCEAERTREFAAARNREINASIAAVAGARAMGKLSSGNTNTPAKSSDNSWQMDTGALGLPVPTLKAEPPHTLNRSISAEPCRAVGPIATLRFTGTDTNIDPAMKPSLDRLISIARACPAVRIEAHGHSDAAGSVFINRGVAQARAQAAVDYLVAAGIAPNRLAAIGHSSLEPVVPSTSEANRAYNRRVEFSIKDPAMQAAARRVMWDLAELLDPTYVPAAVAGLSP